MKKFIVISTSLTILIIAAIFYYSTEGKTEKVEKSDLVYKKSAYFFDSFGNSLQVIEINWEKESPLLCVVHGSNGIWCREAWLGE